VTLKSRLRGYSPCEFMHDLYIAELKDPEQSVVVADSTRLFSITSTQPAPEKLTLRSFDVIQDHRNWYNVKHICDFLIVLHCNDMPIFYRFRDVTIYWSKICVFHEFCPSQSRLKLSQWDCERSTGTYRYESSSTNKPRLKLVRNRCSYSYYFERTAACDRQTDRRHAAYS